MDALAAREAYLYGFYGIPDKLLSRHPLFYTNLPDARQQEIYEFGKQARDRSIETKWQRMQQKKNAAALTEVDEIAGFDEETVRTEEDAAAEFGEENFDTAADNTTPEAEIVQIEDELPVEESAERGIISNEELYRKAPDSRKGFKFISQERFDSLTVEAKKNGATIVRATRSSLKNMEGSDKMAKVKCAFTILNYTVMVLDEEPPLTNYTKYKIDGKLYEPVIVYDAPTSIAVEAFGNFEGKTVEFVRI